MALPVRRLGIVDIHSRRVTEIRGKRGSLGDEQGKERGGAWGKVQMLELESLALTIEKNWGSFANLRYQ